MPASDIKELAEDIKLRGLQNSITLFEDKILDGQHRYEACSIAGVKPRFETYKGNDPLGFVIAANLKRRHLTPSQKAMVAASIENMPHGRSEKKDANLHLTRTNAADSLDISPRSVATASKILDESPRLAQQVRDGKLTVHAAAEKLAEKKTAAKPTLDDIGTPIPKDALPFWKRRQEVQDILTELSRIKCAVEKAKADGDPMFGKVGNGVISDLTQAYTHLLEAKPYAVCTTCMGSPSAQPKGCSMCGNKGLISKWQWDTQSRKEIKEIRLKSNAKLAECT